jgi:hypothetical protein
MKGYFFTGVLGLIVCSSFGQDLQQVTDNGATTTNPIFVSTVTTNSSSLSGTALPTNINVLNGYRLNGTVSNFSHNGITYQSGGGGGAAIGFSRGGASETAIDFYTNSANIPGNIYHRMRISSEGKVGIGTYSPQSNLHVVGSGANKDGGNVNRYNVEGLIVEAKSGGRSTTVGAELEFVIPANTDGSNEWGQGRIMTVAGNSASSDATGKMIFGTRRMFDKNGTGQEWFYGDDIVIDGQGNIGVGTLIPKEKLSVNGKIRAHEIKVELTGWPDYVFAKDYPLATLQQTENHIKEKGYLPGIPSSAEVKANGIDLGEMNAKLLQKIEELTLHLIEQNKKTARLEEIISRNKLN